MEEAAILRDYQQVLNYRDQQIINEPLRYKYMSDPEEMEYWANLKSNNMEEQSELSFGEQLVGIKFNPSNDDQVYKAKSLCAELANMVNNLTPTNAPYIFNLIKGKALGEILNAQMNVVKLITLKY